MRGEFLRVDWIELIPVGGGGAGNFAPSEAGDGIPDATVQGLGAISLDATAAFADPEEDALTYALVSGPDWISVDPATGAITGTPPAGGVYAVTVSAEDAANNPGILATSDFTLTVEDAGNATPTLEAEIADQTVAQGGAVNLDVTTAFSDPDGDALTYSVAGDLPPGVTFADGVFGGAPDATASGAYEVTVTATDAAGSNTGVSDTFLFTVTGPDNAAPTAVTLTPVVASLAETADTAAAIVVATIAVTDDGLGVNGLSLSGDDAALFEIFDNAGSLELRLVAGATLDFATNPALDVTVEVDDATVGASPDATAGFTLAVTEVDGNAAPVVDAEIADQTVDRGAPVALDVTAAFSDPDGDALTYTVTGSLPAGVTFADGVFGGAVDETATPGAYNVTVTATDAAGSNTGVSDTFVLTVTGGVDTRPTVRIEAEDGALSGGFSVESDRIRTSGDGEATYDLSGVAGGDYLVRLGYWDENDGASSVGVTMSSASAGTFSDTLALDEATLSARFSSKNYRETTLDGAFKLGANGLLTLTGLAQGSEIVRIDYIELIPTGAPAGNAAPSVSLVNALAGIPDDADTGAPIKVADIVVSDDGQGVNALGLAGADAGLFEIFGTGLFLKAGSTLDAAANPSLDVTVTVDDASVGGSPDGTALLSLPVTETGGAPSVSVGSAPARPRAIRRRRR